MSGFFWSCKAGIYSEEKLNSYCFSACAKCTFLGDATLCVFCPVQEVGACLRTTESLKPVHFTFRNCSSVQTFRPRFCGQCSDGRCCTPHTTKTTPVKFRCPNGTTLKRLVMLIRTCVCHRNCPAEDRAPQHWPEIGFTAILTR